MKKTFTYLLIITILVMVAIHFNQKKESQKKSIKPSQKITVLLDWFPNTNHTGLYVANANGYFKREGLDVNIIQPGESEATQIVASGKADFGISSQESVTLARNKNIPIVSVAAIIQHNTSAFASKKEAGIETVADFEGKRYGGWGSPIEEATLKALMKNAHTNYSKIKNITIGTTDFFSTIGKQSDFQWIFYGWDGVEAKRRGIALNLIWLKELDPVLDYYTPVIITNEKHLKEQKDLTRKFMKAVVDGYEYTISYPKESAEILAKAAPELNKDLVFKSQEWLSPEYKKDAIKWGLQKNEVWERYAKWLYDRKLIDKMLKPDDAFTNEFLP